MPEDVNAEVISPQLSTGVGLADVLPFLVGLGRTGRLSAKQGDAPALEVWIERGLVVDAAWGRLRALSALELGVVFLPRASFVFSDGLKSETPTFDLSPTDLAVRLAEVAREGVALARSIPGPSAVPAKLNVSRQAHDPEAVRLLDQIDGHRSVAELVAGRQPLVVLRGLASLLEHGAIGFERTPTDPAPPRAPLVSAPPTVEAPPAASIPPVGPTTVAGSTGAAAAQLGPPAPTAPERLAPAAAGPRVGPSPPATTSAQPRSITPGAGVVPPITAPPPSSSRPPVTTPPATAPAAPPAAASAAASGTVASATGQGVPAEACSRHTAAPPVESSAAAAAAAPAAPHTNALPPSIRGAEPGPRTASGSEVASRAAVAANASAHSGTPSAEVPMAKQARRPGRVAAFQARRSTRLLIVALALVPLALVIVANLRPLTPEGVRPVGALPVAPTAAVPPTAVRAQAQPPAPTPAGTATGLPAQAQAPEPTPAPPPTTSPALAQPATAPPAATKPPIAPSVAVTPAPAAQAAQSLASPVAAPTLLLDERFSTNPPGWPNAPTSSSWWDAIGYHLEPRVAGQHVATAAPASTTLGDFSLTALFRKLGGPAGGGYGLIVRAQGGPFDGTDQGGRYYVFEVGDRGDVGAWRREEDHWVDLLAWTHSDAVHPGASENRLVVLATGSRFAFSVNDVQVAEVTDATLASGAVGVFTGGDGNQVLLERFTLAKL